MQIATTFLVGFLAVLAATVGLGTYSIYSIRTMNDLIKRTCDNALMTSAYAQSAHTSFVKLDRALTRAAASPNAGEGEAAIPALAGLEKDFQEDLDVVRALEPESRVLVDEVRNLYDTWKRTRMAGTRADGPIGSRPGRTATLGAPSKRS